MREGRLGRKDQDGMGGSKGGREREREGGRERERERERQMQREAGCTEKVMLHE